MKLIIKNLFIFTIIFSFTLRSFALDKNISGKNLVVDKDKNGHKNTLLFIPFGSSFYLLRDNSGKKMATKVNQKNNYKYNSERDK